MKICGISGSLRAQSHNSALLRAVKEIAAPDHEVVIADIPEYNAGIPGVLKNAMDWLSRVNPGVYDGKPTAMMGTSPGKLGTVRAQMQLRNQLANLNCNTVAQPMIFVGNSTEFFGEGATGLDDMTKGFIQKQLAALAALAA